MLALVKLVRRTLEGSVAAIILVGLVALLGVSETVNAIRADLSVSSILFLLMIVIVLADLLAKLFAIASSTFPDLIPKFEEDDIKRASLIRRLRPGPTVALLSGAYAGRVVVFLVIFALLGVTYASAPTEVQAPLFGEYSQTGAIDAFIKEGVAGSIGYFFFFLGAATLEPITNSIASDRIASNSVDGDIFLAGIRLYGLAFVLAVLRTLIAPVTYLRARVRAMRLTERPDPAI
jgi:hypothetical protein